MASNAVPHFDLAQFEHAKAECKRRFLPALSKQFAYPWRSLIQKNLFASPRKGYVVPISTESNIVGIGIGHKIVYGERTPTHSIRFYVRRKLPKAVIPEQHQLPSKIDGLPTDVIESDGFFALAGIQTGKVEPVQPGCSIGFSRSGLTMAGTLGALVLDKDEGPCLLSNNHVLCFEDRLPKGTHILQPGSADGGQDPDSWIGAFYRATALRKARSDAERMDAALAVIKPGCHTDPRALKIGKLKSPMPVARNMLLDHPVVKSGRSTGLTRGEITDVSIDAFVEYYSDTLHLEKLIAIETSSQSSFADVGDSGSMVISEQQSAPVGLVIGRDHKRTLAHTMEDVLRRLEVTIMT